MSSMVPRTDDHKFQNSASANGNGNVFFNDRVHKTLRVKVKRTGGTSTVSFKHAVDNSADYYDLIGSKISAATISQAINTIGTDEVWEFDISASVNVMMPVVVSGGTVDVVGGAVG